MQKVQRWNKVFLLFLLIFFSIQPMAHAEKIKSAKDWIEEKESLPENQGESLPTEDSTGQQEQEIISSENNKVGINAWDFIKMILATIFVVALLYLVLKFVNRKSTNYKDSQTIQNLGGTSLGTNRSVQLIRVGNRVLVVGVGENIQLLKEIDNEEEIRQIIDDYNGKMEQLLSPSDIVTKVIERTKRTKGKQKGEDIRSFSSVFKNQLDRISKERKKLYEEMEKKGSDSQ